MSSFAQSPEKARRAERTASSTSSRPPRARSARGSPVAGLGVEKVSPERAGRSALSIQSWGMNPGLFLFFRFRRVVDRRLGGEEVEAQEHAALGEARAEGRHLPFEGQLRELGGTRAQPDARRG